MNKEEQRIVELLKQGDNHAYKHLYDRHYSLLCGIACEYLKNGFTAQNLVDDLIVHLYENRESLLITTSLRSYLIRSVINRCLNYLQSEHGKKEINFSNLDKPEDYLFYIPDFEDHSLAKLLNDELEQEIHSAIERLPAECRKVFEKSRYEGKTYEAIASELHISVNTVKYHVKNAISLLRKYLNNYL